MNASKLKYRSSRLKQQHRIILSRQQQPLSPLPQNNAPATATGAFLSRQESSDDCGHNDNDDNNNNNEEGTKAQQRSRHPRGNSSNHSPVVVTPPRAAVTGAAGGGGNYFDDNETTPPRRNTIAAASEHDTNNASRRRPTTAVRRKGQESQLQQHQQYRYLSPPEGHDNDIMSTATSVLTDEAMEDRNSMIKNVVQWERRMQLKRQQQQRERQQRQQQLVGLRQSQEEHLSIVNLVHEAINEEMMKKKSPIIRVSSSSPYPPPTTTTTSSSSDEKELPPSPAPTDHSADAAAGMMFALMREKSTITTTTTRTKRVVGGLVKNIEGEVMKKKNEGMIMIQQVKQHQQQQQQHRNDVSSSSSSSQSSPLRGNHHHGTATTTTSSAIDVAPLPPPSTPPRIIISPPSSGNGYGNSSSSSSSSKPPTTPTSTPGRRQKQRRLVNLEQKLGRYTNNSNKNNNASTSSVYSSSSKVSIVSSIQPSIESECIRQNAEILLAMEDAMMNFMGGTAPTPPPPTTITTTATPVQSIDDGDYADDDHDDNFQQVDAKKEGRINEALGGGLIELEEDNNNAGIRKALSPSSEMKALDTHYNNGFHIPLNKDSGGGDTHNKQLSHTHSTLFSLDEREESEDYVDPPLISDDSNSKSDTSSSSSKSSGGREEFVIAKQRSVLGRKDKNLGTFLDQLGSLLGVGCNLDRDEDSDVFYMNNSQFNTASYADVEDMNQRQRRMEAEVVVKAERDTRKSAPLAILGSESFDGESHATMLRGNTAKLRSMYDQHAYLSPARESAPAFQFAWHDIGSDGPPDPELSLDVDDDDEEEEEEVGEVDENVDESDKCDSPPDPEEEEEANVVGNSSGRDPPRGIDPEEGEAVLCRNRVNQLLNLRSLDHVKMSSREKHKGSSLHWQSSNGLILDDETNAKELSSVRAKAREAEKVTSTSDLHSMSISASATILREHFVESEPKLSNNYRRGGGGQFKFIDEVEEDDESDSSAEEESAYQYEQFVEQFRDIVQSDAVKGPEPVEELIIGLISESSSLDDEEVDVDKAKLQNVTQKRELEAGVQRSSRQARYSSQQQYAHLDPKPELIKPLSQEKPQHRHITQSTPHQYAHHDPEPELIKSRSEEKPQQRYTTQSTQQPGNRAVEKQTSRQAAYGHQYKRPQQIPQPESRVTRLEEKLQGLGAPKKLSGDSVGTSELGSLYSAAGVPKTIFHRTYPPSARSTPSSMQNTVDYSTKPAVASKQGTRQHALNTPSRGLTPDLSSQVPLQGRISSQRGHTTANGFGDRFTNSKNTLGFIPIGSETWKLTHEFLDSSPSDPPPRSSPLGFFPSSTDEASHQSDGFGPPSKNTLGSLQVGAETWNLNYDFYDFHESPANRNDPFTTQPQTFEKRHHSEPLAPPNAYRHREQAPSGPPQSARNDSGSSHPPKMGVMKSGSGIPTGTRVQTLRFVSPEDSASPQHPLSQPSRLLPGKHRFQSLPSAVKVARPSSSPPQSQRVSPFLQRSHQTLQRQMLETEQTNYQEGTRIGLRQTTNNHAPIHPVMKRSLEDKLRGMDPPSSEWQAFAEASQVSGSVFEAVEVGSFGVQHTIFSKWDKPKVVNPHPDQPHSPQRQAPGTYHGRRANQTPSFSYVSTLNGRQVQDPVVANLDALRSNRGRFKDRVKAIATIASQKLVMPGAGGSPNRASENQRGTRVYI
jgi:hypothetical protein